MSTATKVTKAAHINDADFLAAVRTTRAVDDSFDDAKWRMRWDVKATLETIASTAIPEKVFLAKAKRLMHRGLLGGCPCGCRGDYHIPHAHPYCCDACDKAFRSLTQEET